ncbi:MAG: isopenicillin N synthase family dioxygenase [Paracoccaceae bacterium]
MQTIPELDLSTGSDAELAAQFHDIYSTYGFGYLRGHGISPEMRDAVFEASRQFHALPEAKKQAIALDRTHRGYIAINTSTDVNTELAEVTKPNQSASFMMMREDAAADPATYLSGPNKWPDLDGFRDTLTAYHTEMCNLGRRVMRIALMAAGAKDDSYMSAFDTPTTWLRLLHYPPRPDGAPADLYGSAPHTDFGCLTFLAQDPVGGLQVLTPEGDWIDAPYREGTFVVSVGDMLHRLSNGQLKSTPHRVINRSGRERYSCPFFFDPHVSAQVAPLPGTGEPTFEPLNFGEFLRGELEAGYDAHKDESA